MNQAPTQEKRWVQGNNSDLFGNISQTKNITFDLQGYLTLSHSPRSIINQDTDDFNNPAAILFIEEYGYFAQTWDKPFAVNPEVLAHRPTVVTDAINIDGAIQSDVDWVGAKAVMTQDDNVVFYDPTLTAGFRWTDTNISLTDTFQSQHPVVNFLSLAAVAIADVNTVKVYKRPITATPVLVTTLVLPEDHYITDMVYSNQNLYVATMNRYGGHAHLFVWNGQGSAAQQAHEVDSNMIFAMCVHKGGIALLTANGALSAYNGGGFTPLDQFPIFHTDRALTDVVNIGMYKNIMKSNGDVIYILFTDDQNSQQMLNQPEGVWCYDERVGLYHRYALSNSLVLIENVDTSEVNTTTDQITVTTPAVPTGTELFYRDNGGAQIGGLTDEQKYFAIKVDATHIRLAATKADALNGTYIDLTSTGNVAQQLIVFPNVDFGAFYTRRTMALGLIERPVNNTQYGTDIIWGAEVDPRIMTGDDANLGSVSNGVEARGYFITPKITSKSVTDTFNTISLKFSPFTSELDKIIIKWRTKDDRRDTINTNNNRWLATWTSPTTFTTTEVDFALAKVGNEVEMLRGAAGGLLAHITAIENDGAGTYTVTIDETFDNYITGDKSVVVFRNWEKWKTIAPGDEYALDAFISKQLGETGKFLQLKIELRGIGVRIEELQVDDVYNLPSKKT